MATTMNSHSHHLMHPRSATQKVCIGMGILFVMGGLSGVVMPGMFGLHLGLAASLMYLLSGVLSLACGYADAPRKSYLFCIAFGVVYGLLAICGFVFGEPGYPGVGFLEADQYLLRIIPNALEFATADHILHFVAAAVFSLGAYAWNKKRTDTAKVIVTTQARPSEPKTYRINGSSDVFRTSRNANSADPLNSESSLKDAKLGTSDINHRSDINRRKDIERRV
jgi:hypothetical protein